MVKAQSHQQSAASGELQQPHPVGGTTTAASSGGRAGTTTTITGGRSGKRKDSAWEILGSLEKGVAYTIKPKRYEACLLKRRKWPLKGWHKRVFVMDQGVLLYGKSSADIARGRTLGKISQLWHSQILP